MRPSACGLTTRWRRGASRSTTTKSQDIEWWEAQSKAHGFIPLTWFVITSHVGAGGIGGTWDTFNRLQSEGYHMESHTVTHFYNLPADWRGVDWDYSQWIQDLNARLTNRRRTSWLIPEARSRIRTIATSPRNITWRRAAPRAHPCPPTRSTISTSMATTR